MFKVLTIKGLYCSMAGWHGVHHQRWEQTLDSCGVVIHPIVKLMAVQEWVTGIVDEFRWNSNGLEYLEKGIPIGLVKQTPCNYM